jgi:hypothetical protein
MLVKNYVIFKSNLDNKANSDVSLLSQAFIHVAKQTVHNTGYEISKDEKLHYKDTTMDVAHG